MSFTIFLFYSLPTAGFFKTTAALLINEQHLIVIKIHLKLKSFSRRKLEIYLFDKIPAFQPL
jgi:hypothetical protein